MPTDWTDAAIKWCQNGRIYWLNAQERHHNVVIASGKPSIFFEPLSLELGQPFKESLWKLLSFLLYHKLQLNYLSSLYSFIQSLQNLQKFKEKLQNASIVFQSEEFIPIHPILITISKVISRSLQRKSTSKY